jgi:UDP-N-acetylglucosamine--N-acetylmuramyl-(pentapeptide) pyrophosphoryl-undecaprenol N-acetylglucosamine transferase
VTGRVIVAAGGTGGHLFPGLALASALAERGRDVAFVGTDRGLESRVVPEAGFEFHAVQLEPFARKVSPEAFRGPTAALRAVGRCREVVRGANAVLGMGGYVSVPTVIAARRERVPVVLHEQNAVAGLANRSLSRVSAAVALGFADADRSFPRERVVVTGNPVRASVLQVREERERLVEEARSAFGLDVDRRTIVVFGGSQGAAHVNEAAIGAARLLNHRADLQLVLLTGQAHLEPVRRDLPSNGALLVRAVGFLDRMELVYAIADLVVARAGASSVAEITVCGLPALFVPYPHAIAGEQEANARAVQRAGGASILMDDELTADSLAERILALVDHEQRLQSMCARSSAFGVPDATDRLIDVIQRVAR